MKNNPEYAEVKGKRYKINTDYRVILRCNSIARDESIGDYERALAIIYLLYGDEGLEDKENLEELLKIGFKFISMGKDEENDEQEIDMDFEQDFSLIKASFMSDYGIDLNNTNMHWWDFYNYLNGLTDKCILNRVREIRTYDLKDVSDEKDKRKLIKAKKNYALKKKEEKPNKKQQESVDKFYKLTGIKRR